MRTNVYMFVVLLAIATQACNSFSKKESNYAVVNLNRDDKTFLALKDTAQSHILQFTNSLKQHGGDTANYTFITKSDFEESGTHEHMWSRVYTVDNHLLKGELIDSAFNLKRIKIYDKVELKVNEVEDWVITTMFISKRLVGFLINIWKVNNSFEVLAMSLSKDAPRYRKGLLCGQRQVTKQYFPPRCP